MKPIPSGTLRTNLGTWAVRDDQLPLVARAMLDALPPESFDPAFRGQHLETTYFDTKDFRLRKARVKDRKYLTLRVRCYRQDGEGESRENYAFSAKTEDVKVRFPIPSDEAEFLLAGPNVTPALVGLLPPDMAARLSNLIGEDPLLPVACVYARRYATEDAERRLTLDTGIHTDRGECLPFNVLEFKATEEADTAPGGLLALGLRPIKSSKFLWATREM